MKKCLHIVTMSCIRRQQNATTWCLEVMHAQGLEIVHVCGTAKFATTVLALLPAQLLALVQAVLQAPGPGVGAGVIAGNLHATTMVKLLVRVPTFYATKIVACNACYR